MLDLTVIILTKDEELNLRNCVESFEGIAKRFVVVDSYSTDTTVNLAKELGRELSSAGVVVDVYQHRFESHAAQFNWALDNADIATAWTMRIDADERLTPELVRELATRLPGLPSDVVGVNLKRRVYFMGKWMRHGGCYPVILLRIFRTGMARSEETLMDEHIVLNDGHVGRLVTLEEDFIDFNTKSLNWWISKHNWYSDLELKDHLAKKASGDSGEGALEGQSKAKRILKNKGYYRLPRFTRAHLYYLYRYYLRFGFLDGTEGKIFHFLQAYWYRFLVDAKIFEYSSARDGWRSK